MKYLIRTNDIVAEKAKDVDYKRIIVNTVDNSVIAEKIIGKFDYIDLGLPSGTMWMKYNIGASKETDYGLYFQWGDVFGYSMSDADEHSTWDTCPGTRGGDTITNSGITSGLTAWDAAHLTDGVLDTSVDAAYVYTNGNAKMPTLTQFEELTANTTMEWATMDNVNGMKFTNKSDSSKYIFLPACGYFFERHHFSLESYSEYWSSSIQPWDTSRVSAWTIETTKTWRSLPSHNRHTALPIRGVKA